MTSITNSIKKICVTPAAVASGDGYHIKKTTPITTKVIRNEINKWLIKKFRRFDIITLSHSFMFVFNFMDPKYGLEILLILASRF